MCVCEGLDEPDNTSVYAAHGGATPVCGGDIAGCCRGRLIVYWKEHLQERTGINTCCFKMKQLGQDEAGEARKDGIRG